MNFAPYLRLLWKEYRAIRVFWLCLIALVIFLQWLVTNASHDSTAAAIPIFTLALATPALFALGCAGTAFAIEKEDATYDFLQAIPATSAQLLISKLLLTVLATVAMYLVLWLPAMWFTGRALPNMDSEVASIFYRDSNFLPNMFNMWFVAALEAIAWGTLFSLIIARPLVAIVLAVAVGSTATNFLAWRTVKYGFDHTAYVNAIPTRVLLAALILALDIYLGLRWLHGQKELHRRRNPITDDLDDRPLTLSTANALFPDLVLQKPERSTMLAHLFWQQWRQSGWLMILMAGLSIGLTLWWHLGALVPAQSSPGPELPMFLFAALMGAFVFRSDQEGRRFRFFVEHNVPPRYVWLTRQLPWIITLCVSTVVAYLARYVYLLYVFVYAYANWSWYERREGWLRNDPSTVVIEILLSVACVALCYSAGQWTSMFIRSGLLAGSVGVVLAAVIIIWSVLMFALRVNWLWAILAIPLILLWATWLRAPDWIRENTSWRARFKAAAAVLVPTLALWIAVPMYRVYQIPRTSPGFSPSAYLAEITPQAKQTAELYRHAAFRVKYESGVQPSSTYLQNEPLEIYRSSINRSTRIDETEWLKANADLIPEVLQLSRRESCAFEDPSTMRSGFARPISLIWLLVASAHQLEQEGKLDEALDRYFAALRLVSQFTENSPVPDCTYLIGQAKGIVNELSLWGAQKGQTPERIRGAMKRLETLDQDIFHLERSFQYDYILERRLILGDPDAFAFRFGGLKGAEKAVFIETLSTRLMPWEKYRRLRELDWMSLWSLETLRPLLTTAESLTSQLTGWRIELPHWQSQSFMDSWKNDYERNFSRATTTFAEFEAVRRGTLIVLALEAYRLEHSKLPDSLDVLAGAYFEQVPQDPFSGTQFLYFPAGVSGVKESNDYIGGSRPGPYDWRHRWINAAKSCLWCTSQNLSVGRREITNPGKAEALDYSLVVNGTYRMLTANQALIYGHFFPIPDQR